jgi:DNA polymerase I-like protein with 3'-5' exonuclease and polymerase domains
VGLGYPGGLGAETFVALAKTAYEIDVTLEQAEQMREVWFETYPEAVDYFKWVNKDCKDPSDHDLYLYVSPLGMVRAGATYCACANGAALQTPASEGAKLAVFRLAKNCWLSRGDLEGTLPVAFIHDEILAEVPIEKSHEAACSIARIMVESMQTVLPDVKIKAEPCLMERWDKRAEPVFKEGRLMPWRES